MLTSKEDTSLKFEDIALFFIIFFRFVYISRTIIKNDMVYYFVNYGLSLYVVFKLFKNCNKEKSIWTNIIYVLKNHKYLSFLLLYFVILLVKTFYYGNFNFSFYSPLNDVINVFNLILFLLLGIYTYERSKNNNYFLKKLIQVTFYSIIITVITTIIYLQYFDPLASRRGKGIKYGVADFSFIYGSIFIVPMVFNYNKYLFSYARYKDKKLSSQITYKTYVLLLQILIFLILLYFTLKTGFMISTIFLIYLFVNLILINYINLNLKQLLYLHLATLMFVFLFRVTISKFLFNISVLFEKNWVVSQKIKAIANLLSWNKYDLDTLSSRYDLTILSVKSFIRYPIFGIPFSRYDATTIGNHTHWFDMFARTGISSILFLLFYYEYYKFYVQHNTQTIKVSYFSYLLLGFFNPILSTQIIILNYVLLLPHSIIKLSHNIDNEKDELVSIVIPVYNASSTILTTVKSVLDQTYENLEIILINDGSHDDSGTKLETIKKLDERIFVYHKENGGVSSARNLGIEKSTGTYIAFLDADDYYDPRFIEYTLNPKVDISFSSYNVVTEQDIYPIINNDYYIYNQDLYQVLFNYLSRQIKIHTSNWIIRTDLVKEHEIRFKDGLNWSEDILFFSECLLVANTCGATTKSLTYYKNDVLEGRLSTVNTKRIEYEIRASKILILKIKNSKLNLNLKKKLIDLIQNYRLPATIYYTISELPEKQKDFFQKYVTYLEKINLINGLRSVKLKILWWKDKFVYGIKN